MTDTFTSLLRDYVDNGSTEDMVMLGKMIADFISDVEEEHPEKVERLLHKMSCYLSPFKCKSRVMDIVSKFKNEDGTTGEHWDYDTVVKVADSEGITDYDKFYYVLNMIYSDYYYSGYSDKDYIRMAKQFCMDKDAPSDKAIKYFRMTNF